MNCIKCGNILNGTEKFCGICGTPVPVDSIGQQVPVQPVTPVQQSVQSVQPIEPIAPVAPVAPVVPTEPVTPVVPVAPISSVESAPIAPIQPEVVQPVTPIQTVEPVPSAEVLSANPVGAPIVEQPVQPVVDSIQSVQPVVEQPVVSSIPVAPTEPVVQVAQPSEVLSTSEVVEQSQVVQPILDNNVMNSNNNLSGAPLQPEFSQSVQPVVEQVVQPINVNNNVSKPIKKDKTFIIIVIVLFAIILCLGGYIVSKGLNGTSTNNKANDNKVEDTANDDTKNDEVVSTNEVKSFQLDGYTFKVPDGYEYTDSEGITTITSNESAAILYTYGTSYELFTSSYADSLKQSFISQGFTIYNSDTTTVSGREFYLIGLSKDDESCIYFITKLTDNNIMHGAIESSSTDGYVNTIVGISDMIDNVMVNPNKGFGNDSLDLNSNISFSNNIKGIQYEIAQ